MWYLKVSLFLIVLALFGLFFPEGAFAWGPAVHTAIAVHTLKDATLLLPPLAQIIAAYPLEYAYGCLSADFFLGKGRKGAVEGPHHWKGGFRFLEQARSDQERAYALGFLSHLAADVIAHNFFIPNLVSLYPGRGRLIHIYWELRSDQLIGSEYTRMAKGILAMDHRPCDELLKAISGKHRKGLGAKKRVYTHTVKASDYLNSTRDFLFDIREFRDRPFDRYLASMLQISFRLTRDFLHHPFSSPCLQYDPVGVINIALANKTRMIPRLFARSSAIPRFPVSQELLRV